MEKTQENINPNSIGGRGAKQTLTFLSIMIQLIQEKEYIYYELNVQLYICYF